jgi:hypothetical protein
MTDITMTPQRAALTIKRLFNDYGITDQDQAKRLVRERFSQADLDTYKAAMEVLDGSGALG